MDLYFQYYITQPVKLDNFISQMVFSLFFPLLWQSNLNGLFYNMQYNESATLLRLCGSSLLKAVTPKSSISIASKKKF